jgi:glycosyltransferase involved in cell wall biosynthesis
MCAITDCPDSGITVSAPLRKVIQLTPYYPPHLGGVERVAQALARGLSTGHDVEVWTTDLGTVEGQAESTEAFPVYRLPAFEIAHTPVAPGLPRRLLALPAESVVHVHVAQALWPELVALAAARRRFSMVAHFHLDVDATGGAGFLLPAYKRHCLIRTLQRADAVVALTTGQAEFLVEEYAIAPRRLVVMPNGVDHAFLELGPSPRRGQPLHVLFVGRLDAQKNIPRLLRAVARVTEPVEVVVVGDGEERERCESIREQLGVGHVRFVGPQYGHDLVGWYDWADLFVLPSDREGMPLVLLEAMAAGLAVVTTDVSELGDLVGDAGLVVPAGAQPLAGAISLLAGDRDLLAALQQRSRARGRSFGWDVAVAQLTRLYESLPA